jgi:hypothetical protein
MCDIYIYIYNVSSICGYVYEVNIGILINLYYISHSKFKYIFMNLNKTLLYDFV